MPSSTPFFDAFGSLLFGRPARSLRDQLCAKLRTESISELQEAFGSMIHEVLLCPQQNGIGSRQRRFSPLLTFWAFLSQVISPNSSCREAVRKVQAWWALRGQVEISPDTSAYCQARARLPEKTLGCIHEQLADRLESNVPSQSLWLGRNVRIVDGTNLSMPDTGENQAAYPQPSSQKPGCGFPMMKLVGIFSLASGALLHFARGTLGVHESQLFRQLWNNLRIGDVILSDRGFCSFFSIHSLLQLGVDGVMRLHKSREVDFRRGKRLGKDDFLLQWKKPRQRAAVLRQEEFDALPESLQLRHIRLAVNVKGFRTRNIILVTTLLDPEAYPAEAIAKLYLQRWSVELHFREIKILLGLDILSCLSPEMIQKELIMHVIAYNLVRALMQHAAICHHVDLDSLSFKGTLDTLRHFADVMQASHGKPRKQAALLDAMFLIIAQDQLPLRPSRSEPRVKKRRPKNYQLLNKPRKEMSIHPHRNRPKASLT